MDLVMTYVYFLEFDFKWPVDYLLALNQAHAIHIHLNVLLFHI